MKQARGPDDDERRFLCRLREFPALRRLLPDAINSSDIVDEHRGAVIRRLLQVAKDPRRASALAARRRIALRGDIAQRFELLFIERDGQSTWLLNKSGQRVAWLGGGETVEVASHRLPLVFDARVKASDDRAVARVRQLLADARRPPKRPGRPAGRRDASPGRLVRGFDRATHEQLAEQLNHARTKLRWRGARVLREAEHMNNPAAQSLFATTPETRALLEAITEGRSTRVEILRRIERQFLPWGNRPNKISRRVFGGVSRSFSVDDRPRRGLTCSREQRDPARAAAAAPLFDQEIRALLEAALRRLGPVDRLLTLE